MSKLGNKLVIATLVVLVIGIFVALMIETSRNPTFRAEDYESLEECLENIPRDWTGGTVEGMGAEAACRHLHAPSRPAS